MSSASASARRPCWCRRSGRVRGIRAAIEVLRPLAVTPRPDPQRSAAAPHRAPVRQQVFRGVAERRAPEGPPAGGGHVVAADGLESRVHRRSRRPRDDAGAQAPAWSSISLAGASVCCGRPTGCVSGSGSRRSRRGRRLGTAPPGPMSAPTIATGHVAPAASRALGIQDLRDRLQPWPATDSTKIRRTMAASGLVDPPFDMRSLAGSRRACRRCRSRTAGRR